MRRRVLFRANGNSLIGYGHIIRSIALAEKLRHDFDIVFACSGPDNFVKEQVARVGKIIELESLQQFLPDDPRSSLEIPYDLDAHISATDIVVLDGYRFGTAYRKAIKATGAKLVCIDDLCEGEFPADLIINPSPLANSKNYHAVPETKFCLGLKYMMLRDAFFKKANEGHRSGIMIAMGGTDPYNLSAGIIQKCLDNPNEKISVITTNGFSINNLQLIKELAETYTSRVFIKKDLSGEEMVDVMDEASFAILPASGITIEALKRKLTVMAGFYADNQKQFYQYFTENNYCIALGDLRINKSETLSQIDDSLKKSINQQAVDDIATADFKSLFHELTD